jgi:hypothetical protein
MLKVMPRTAGRIVIAVLHQHCCSLGERRTGSWHISGLGRWREAAVGKKAELGWCHITQEWLRRALVGRVISHAWRAPPGDFRFCACGPTLIAPSFIPNPSPLPSLLTPLLICLDRFLNIQPSRVSCGCPQLPACCFKHSTRVL